jgi:hypothetical protein
MSGGGGKGGGSQVTGYRYSFGIHMGLGRGPVDEIVEVRVGDKTAWSPVTTGSYIKETKDVYIDQYNLFGGEGKEGGIQGNLQIMMGEPDQVAASGLRSMLGETLPGFRRTVTAFFKGIVAMNNPYPKPWKFRMRRIFKGWDGEVFQPSTALIPIDKDGTVLVGPEYISKGVLGFAVAQDSGNSETAAYATYNTGSPDLSLFGELGVPQTARCVTTLGPNNLDTGVAPMSIVPIDPDKAYIMLYRTPGTSSDKAWMDIEFLNQSGAVVAALRIEPNEVFQIIDGTVYWRTASNRLVGPSLASLTSKGNILLGGSETIFFPDGAMYCYGSVFYCDSKSIRSARLSNFRASYNYTGEFPGFSAYAIFRKQDTPFTGTVVPADMNGINSMNPAHIIYECLTNREWGRGFPTSIIDVTSFASCAQTLFGERFGLCLKWSRSDSIDSFIQGVIDHIGASYYQSRTTGLMTLKLIRDDYAIEDLPLYDTDSGITRINESSISSPINGVNQIEVTYHDPISDEDMVVKVDNIAAIQTANGNVNLLQKSYPGIPTAALAQRIAQRDLRAASSVLRRFSFNMDRRGRMLAPGSVIRLRDEARGIPETVVRIVTVEDGTNTSGEMTFTGVQDVFALPASSYAIPVPNTWEPPDLTPCLDVNRVIEMPYFLVNHTTSTADLATIDPAAGFIGTMVGRGKNINVGYKIAVRDGAATPEDYPNTTNQYCGFTPDWN